MCFINYIKAGYPLLWVRSYEEHRILMQYTSLNSMTKPLHGMLQKELKPSQLKKGNSIPGLPLKIPMRIR